MTIYSIMTAAHLAGLIGRTAHAPFSSSPTNAPISVQVFIRDAKVTWGRTRYLVEPVCGSGATWVESITLDES